MKKLIVFFNILLLSIFTIYLFKDIFSTKNLQKEPINASINEFKKKNEVHEQSKFRNSLSPLNLDFTNAGVAMLSETIIIITTMIKALAMMEVLSLII